MVNVNELEDGLLAAVDLGSNSFHMVVARLDHGEIRMLESLSEKVQLAAGFDEKGRLTEVAQDRALSCLSRFAQHLKGVEPRRLRIVGTNALRVAKNAASFIKKAERLMSQPIEVIAGREEARLIYLGVSHSLANQGRRLVVDIGGGSTEFIIGERFEPLLTESLHMGCVSFTTRYFPDGDISREGLERAIMAARQEVLPITSAYRELGWNNAVGASGTLKAICQVLQQTGLASEGSITLEGLRELADRLLHWRHVQEIDFPGLKEDRKPILPAGLAITTGFFEELGVDHMEYSEGALREGVLYDMLGRFSHEDIRDRTVQALQGRYHVDLPQAERVRQTALALYDELVQTQPLAATEGKDLLERAALLHEIGLGISHSGFHKHGAYILRYSDLPGFSRQAQEKLALIVGTHRRKIREEQKVDLSTAGGMPLLVLCLLLRVAVTMHHSRSRESLPRWRFQFRDGEFLLQFPKGWLERNPLTHADFQQEADWLETLGLVLRVV